MSITPGVRFNQWDINSNLIDKSYSEPTLALALEYAIDSATTIKASATELFKGPELSEVFTGAGNGDVYNEDVEAETGLNTEFGVSHQGETFTAGFTIFETQIENYIYDYIDNTLYEAPLPKDNIGDMRISGIEANWGINLDKLDLLFTYSLANSKLSVFDEYYEMACYNQQWCSDGTGTPVLDDAGDVTHWIQEGFDGARTDRTYASTYGINADYHFTSTDVYLHYDVMHISHLAAGKDLDGAGLDNSKDAYSVHNVSVKWQPESVEGLSLTLGVDNLFDKYYASQASRTGVSNHPVFGELYLTDYEPGRNVKASVAYQF